MCTRANYQLAFIFVRNGFCNSTIMVTPFYNRVGDELKPYFLFFHRCEVQLSVCSFLRGWHQVCDCKAAKLKQSRHTWWASFTCRAGGTNLQQSRVFLPPGGLCSRFSTVACPWSTPFSWSLRAVTREVLHAGFSQTAVCQPPSVGCVPSSLSLSTRPSCFIELQAESQLFLVEEFLSPQQISSFFFTHDS